MFTEIIRGETPTLPAVAPMPVIDVNQLLDEKIAKYPEFADMLRGLAEVWHDFKAIAPDWAEVTLRMIRDDMVDKQLWDVTAGDHMNMRKRNMCVMGEIYGWNDSYYTNKHGCADCETYGSLMTFAKLYTPNPDGGAYRRRLKYDPNTLRVVPPLVKIIPAVVLHVGQHERGRAKRLGLA